MSACNANTVKRSKKGGIYLLFLVGFMLLLSIPLGFLLQMFLEAFDHLMPKIMVICLVVSFIVLSPKWTTFFKRRERCLYGKSSGDISLDNPLPGEICFCLVQTVGVFKIKVPDGYFVAGTENTPGGVIKLSGRDLSGKNNNLESLYATTDQSKASKYVRLLKC